MNWFSSTVSTDVEKKEKDVRDAWTSPNLTIDDIKGLVNFIAENTRLGKCDIEQFQKVNPVYTKLCDSVKQHPDNFVIIKDVFVPSPDIAPETESLQKETKKTKEQKLYRKKKKKKRA